METQTDQQPTPEARRLAGVIPLTLQSAIDGELEEMFARRLVDALSVFREHFEFVEDKAGNIVVTIPVEVKLVYNPSTGTMYHAGSVQHVKKPKVRGNARAAFWEGNTVSVKPEVQIDLAEVVAMSNGGK